MLKFCLNTFLKSRIPYLISGYEEKCLVVIRCCGFAASMQHTYLQTLILQAFTVLQTLIWSEATTRENEVFSSLFQSDNERKRSFLESVSKRQREKTKFSRVCFKATTRKSELFSSQSSRKYCKEFLSRKP